MSANIADEKTLGRDEKGMPIVSALEVDVADDEMNQAEDIIKAEQKYTPQQMSRLRWKIDLILMPIMMFTYGLQYSDKVSLSSGVVFGLKPDTGLVGNEYAFLTIWFYLAYMIGQLPMQWVLQKVPLGKGLAVTCLCWGLCVVCLGVCNNYAQLSAVRFLLGWFECAITPGFLLIVASWYKRSESTLRSCLFFSMNTCFSIIFGVAIYFIAKNAQENGGPAGWRVINYFLGALTIFDGFLLLAFLGTPREVWWLNKEQKEMAHARIVSNATGGGEQHPWKWEQVRECFRDPQWYFAILFNLMATIPNGALGTFQVLIFSSFGFDALGSILYGLPSSAIGCVFIIISALVVTKWPRMRFVVAVVMNIVPMCVFLYVGLVDAGKWHKWACFSFVSVFAISTFMLWSIIPINTAGRTKKSFMSACVFVAYCAGNIVGSQIFLPSDAPKYLKGLTACAIVMAVNTINMIGWYMYYRWTNAKREQAFQDSGMSMEERVHLNKLAGETDLTDLQNPHFRYTC